MKKIHLIIGARPNIMKMGPLYKELQKHSHKYITQIVHTGQHYDERMSDLFFSELNISKPDFELEVGSASHAEQTARIMERYEEVVLKSSPDLIIVAGDVNSTLACTLVATKLHIPIAHLEAGLRSFDRSMPEEINRIVTDSISDLLLTPSKDADINLTKEGFAKEKIHFVGNIMIDSLINNLNKAKDSDILNKLTLEPQSYILMTMHRPSNVDNLDSLKELVDVVRNIANLMPVVIPIHPRTESNIKMFGLESEFYSIKNLFVLPPVGYHDMLKLEMNANCVVTDSGGIQEETTFMGVPCLTVRENTERPITITSGTNKLVKLNTKVILAEIDKILSVSDCDYSIPEYWDGNTSARIVDVLDNYFKSHSKN